MKRTVETSPFYSGWLETVENDLILAKEAIKQRDFNMLGSVVEANALKMHATTLGATPPFTYWQGGTIDVMREIRNLRDIGVQVFFTIDAGPNVKVLCLPKDEQLIQKKLLTLLSVQNVLICHPGSGVTYLPINKNKRYAYFN